MVSGASLGVSQSSANMPITEIANFLADAFEAHINTGRSIFSIDCKSESPQKLNVNIGAFQKYLSSSDLNSGLNKLRKAVLNALPSASGGRNERTLWGGLSKKEDDAAERKALLRLDTVIRKNLYKVISRDNLKGFWQEYKESIDGGYLTKRMAFFLPTAGGDVNEIARQITAIEEISKENHIQGFLNGVKSKLYDRLPAGDDDGQEDVDLALEAWNEQAKLPTSVMSHFIRELSDIAPSRSRLHISIEILNSYCAMARRQPEVKKNYSNILRYATRLLSYYNYFCIEGKNLSINFPTKEDDVFDFFNSSLASGIYESLPIWFKWDDQIAETIYPSAGNSDNVLETLREISFLPRLNGWDSETKQSAYESMIERSKKKLQVSNGCLTHWDLTKLFLIWFLTNPTSHSQQDKSLNHSGGDCDDFLSQADADAFADILNSFACEEDAPLEVRKACLKQGVEKLCRELQSSTRVQAVNNAARELLQLLRAKRGKVYSGANQNGNYLDNGKVSVFVNINESILGRNLLKTRTKHPFSELHITREDMARFLLRSITVSTEDEIPEALYAYRINYTISERFLGLVNSKGNNAELRRIIRRSSKNFPYAKMLVIPSGACNSKTTTFVDKWSAGFPVINIIYDSDDLDMPRTEGKLPVRQYQEASITASVKRMCVILLSYLITRRLTVSLKEVNDADRGQIQLLRITSYGRDNAEGTGADAIYGGFKAIETNLSSKILIKAQGYNSDPYADSTSRFRQRAATAALDSALSIALDIDSPLIFKKTGIIDYEIRPSDIRDDGRVLSYVTIVRVYTAENVVLKDRLGDRCIVLLKRSESFICTDRADDIESRHNNSAVRMALDFLIRQSGIDTIILIGRQHGDRRIGRSASRNRKADPVEFLARMREIYPHVTIIPLVRKQTHIIRLKGVFNSANDPYAYEIIGVRSHSSQPEILSKNKMGNSLCPLYSIATLRVIGHFNTIDEIKPKSRMTTYSWLQGENDSNYTENTHRAREVLIDDGPAQVSLAHILRALHYIETEKEPTKSKARNTRGETIFAPVLNPLNAKSSGELGEIEIVKDYRPCKMPSVAVNGVALFSRIDDILEAAEISYKNVAPEMGNSNGK